jgi:hypothetical protein
MTVRTLTIQSATQTSQYWVMALVDLPSNSTCSPTNYTVVTDGSGQSLLFSWTPGNSGTLATFVTALVPSTSGQYMNIYIVEQTSGDKGALSYQNPVQK